MVRLRKGVRCNSCAMWSPYSLNPPWLGGKVVTRQIFIALRSRGPLRFDEFAGVDVGLLFAGRAGGMPVCNSFHGWHRSEVRLELRNLCQDGLSDPSLGLFDRRWGDDGQMSSNSGQCQVSLAVRMQELQRILGFAGPGSGRLSVDQKRQIRRWNDWKQRADESAGERPAAEPSKELRRVRLSPVVETEANLRQSPFGSRLPGRLRMRNRLERA